MGMDLLVWMLLGGHCGDMGLQLALRGNFRILSILAMFPRALVWPESLGVHPPTPAPLGAALGLWEPGSHSMEDKGL